MGNDFKRIIKYALSLTVAAVLLLFSFRGVDWNGFAGILGECRWGWVAGAMAASIIAFALRALRWRMLLKPIDPSTSFISTWDAVCIGNFANFVFPRIGEFVRCGYITRNHRKAGYEKVLGTVVLERSWDLMVMIMCIALFLCFTWDRFGAFFRDEIFASLEGRLGNFAVPAIAAAAVLAAAVCIFIVFKVNSRICNAIAGIIRGLWQGICSCVRMEGKWIFLLLTVLIWFMYLMMAWFISLALPCGDAAALGISDALFLMLAGSLGWAVPAPGGIGSFHFIVSLALTSVYSFTAESAMAYAILSHESQALTMILCGLIAYLTETFRRRNIPWPAAGRGLRFGLIGSPIAQSKSPELFRALYKGPAATYDLIENDDFDKAYKTFLDDYDAVNVTSPFKTRALGKADVISPEASLCGATNLLVKTDSGITAYNTDYLALVDMIRSKFPDGTGKQSIVVGAGGAGKAAAAALATCGFTVTTINRTPSKADGPLSLLEELLPQCSALIYTLPCPIAELSRPSVAGWFSSRGEKLVIESSYINPSLSGKTDFDGMDWLKKQALIGYDIFTENFLSCDRIEKK